MSDLINDIDTVGEVLDQRSIEIDTVSFLPDVKVVICIIEIIHPMILTGTSFKKLKYFSAIITLSN